MKFVSDYKELENKKFNTEAELKQAEAEVEKKKTAESAKATERKTDALQVEQAFKLRNAAKKTYNETVINARKEYNEAVVKAAKTYGVAKANAEKILNVAEDNYNKQLTDFIKKYGSYHLTLQDDDNTTMLIHYNNKALDLTEVFNEKLNALDTLWDKLFNPFNW